MEPRLSAPGIYLRGLETAPAPPLETGVTGFIGVAERGPLNSPQPLLGWSDYLDVFGGFVPFGYLAEAVFSFFRNGGEKCWVVRSADTSVHAAPAAGACPPEESLATAEAVYPDHNGDPSLRVRAIDPGSWGDRLEVRIGTSTAPPLRTGTLTQTTSALSPQIFLTGIRDLRPGGVVRLAPPGSTDPPATYTIGSLPTALDPATGRVDLTAPVGQVLPIGTAVLAPGFRIEADLDGRRETFEPLSMDPAHSRYFVPLINGAEPLSDYTLRRSRGLSILMRVEHLLAGGTSRFRPADSPPLPALLHGGGDGFIHARATFLTAANAPLLTVVAKRQRGTAGNGLRVVAVPFRTTTALPVPDDNGGATDRVTVDEIGGFKPGETVRVRDSADPLSETAVVLQVLPAERRLQLAGNLTNAHGVGTLVAVADRFTLRVQTATGEREPLEVIRNLSGNPIDPRFVTAVLLTESDLLCGDPPPAPFTTPLLPGQDAVTVTLGGGKDPGEIDPRYYTGYQPNGAAFHPPELDPEAKVGLASLEDATEVSLTAAPDLVRVGVTRLVQAQTMMLQHCARQGDRFALLDSPGDLAGLSTEDWVAGFVDPRLRRFGAAFHPWLQSTFGDQPRITPPAGFLAGLFARTDVQRGVSKAPANDAVKGAFALVPPVDRDRQGELNPLGVNCVLKLEDGAVRLMGSRTLSADPAARYISVTRSVLALKRMLSRRMLWAVFEPADLALCRRIEATLTTLLQGLVAKGVTAGQRPGQAFYVTCDETNNPADQLREGIVVAEIGIAVLAPAEFLVLTVRRTPDAVHVIEEEV